MDNVAVRVKSSCPAPKNPTVSAITTNTASVAWTEKGEATAWKLQTSTDGENWGDEIAADANPFTLNGLTAETTYYVRVKAICGESESSEWSDASKTFTTKCEAKAIGWSENFDDLSALPSCWESSSYGSGNGQWYAYSNSMRFNARVSSGTSADLVTPLVTLSDASVLTFKHEGTSVDVSVYANTGEGEVLLQTIPKSTATESINLSAYTGQTVSFTFRAYGYSTYSSAYFYLDDVAVNYLPVAAPTNFVATSADASAVITWESDEEGAKFALRYRTNGEGDWTEVTELTAKTYTIESLANGTAYEVQVKAIASANRQSDWTASAVVTPVSCASVGAVTFGDKTYNSVVVNWTTTGAGTWNIRYKTAKEQDWTVVEGNIAENTKKLEGLTPGEVYTIAVKPSCNDGEEAWVAAAETYTPIYTAPENVVVTNITDAAASASWDAVADASGYEYIVVEKDAAENWESAQTANEATVELKNLKGLTDYDFYVRATYPASGASDATKATFATIAIAPKNLTAGEITTTTATFTWENDGAATQYQWSTDNTNWSDAQTELTATATGLTAGTSYTFYVRSYYAEGKYSAAVSQAFSTECATVAIGWSENFGTVTGTKPNCWNIANWGTSANYWTTAGDYAKTGVALRYNARTMSSSDAITPSIEITDKCQLTFYIKNSVGNNSAKVECKVLVNDGNETTEIAHITTRYTTATLQTLDLSAYKGKTVTIIFRGMGYDTSGSPYLWIDDVAVTYNPVATPTNLTATPADASATVTWESVEDGTWNLRYRLTNQEPEADWTLVEGLDQKTKELTGLTNNKEYEIQVQTIASANRQSDWTASAVVTPMACPTVTGIELSEKTYNSVKVSWTTSGAGKWVLEYGLNAPYTTIENLAVTEYVLNNLTLGETYTIKVHPNCSEEGQQTTYQPLYTAPTNVVVTNITDAAASASWDAVSDASGYEYIVVEKDAAENWESAQTANEATVELQNLKGLTDYDFYVRATYPASGASDATKATFATIAIAPKNLTAGEITTTTATFTWEANGAATQYQWSTDNTNWSDAQTELTATATDLNAGTSYTFYVRSYYAEGKYSAAVSLAFATACDVYDMPYAESFEAAGKPLCWEVAEENWAETFSQNSTGNKWSNRYGSTTHQGNYALYYNSKTSTANSADITMPRIAIGKAAKLLFYIKNNYEVTGEVRIAADEVETQVVALKTTGNNFNTLQEIDLNEAFVGKTVTITFHAQGVGTSENSSLAIDDIEIAQVCQKPANLAATATSDGAELTWEGDEDQYQYCVVNSGNDPAGWVLLENDVKSVTITGKQVGKSYDVYVRAYCGAANQSAAVMTTFIPVEIPSALDNSNAANKAVKLIENDQIIIIRDGVKYNAQGQKLN